MSLSLLPLATGGGLPNMLTFYLPYGFFALGIITFVAILWYIFYSLHRQKSTQFAVQVDVSEKLQQVLDGVKHAAEVSAVVALVNQIGDDPQIIARLSNYPTAVVRAAVAHRADTIGDMIRHDQDVAKSLEREGRTGTASISLDRARTLLKELQQLEQATQAH